MTELLVGYHFDQHWTALYLGSVDESKNLEVLWNATQQIFDAHPHFLLIVAGSGASLIPDRPWIIPVGRVSDREKFVLAKHCQVILNPGRVGLVALDSIALGLPLVTTNWNFHGPEIEYLNGVATISFRNTALSFATTVAELISNPKKLKETRENLLALRDPQHFDQFVANFVDAARKALRDY